MKKASEGGAKSFAFPAKGGAPPSSSSGGAKAGGFGKKTGEKKGFGATKAGGFSMKKKEGGDGAKKGGAFSLGKKKEGGEAGGGGETKKAGGFSMKKKEGGDGAKKGGAFSLGGKKKEGGAKSGGFSMGKKKEGGSAAGGFGKKTTSTTSTTSTTGGNANVSLSAGTKQNEIAASARIQNKNLEEIVNMWREELRECVETFTNQAIQISEWDQVVVDNGERITNLHNDTQRVKLAQDALNSNLEFILTQQNDLSQNLINLERIVDDLYASTGDFRQPADRERENAYSLAENINVQLIHMGDALSDMISKLNTDYERTVDGENPIHQIVQILNAHLNSLQWVDDSSATLQYRIDDVTRAIQNQTQRQQDYQRQRYY